MKPDVNLEQKQEQRLVLSQELLQSLELLQIPIMELHQMIMQELSENPTIELSEEIEEEETQSSQTQTAQEAEEKFDILDELEKNIEPEKVIPSKDEEDKKTEFLQNIQARYPNIRDMLYEQLTLSDAPEDIKLVGKEIIYNIDDAGFLKFNPSEIAAGLKDLFPLLSQEQIEQKVKIAIALIQKFEPKGVCASTLKECLLLQLSEEDPNYHLKKKLIEEYLEDISKNKLPEVAKKLMIDLETLKWLIYEISRLNPRPGATVLSEKAPVIYPEVVIKEIDGKYEIVIEDEYIPELIINKNYIKMLRSGKLSKDEREFLKGKLIRARLLVNAVNMRKTLLYKVAELLVKHQTDFFKKGIEHLKPLTMRSVAKELGVSSSTVSRAVAEKFIQTPRGIYNMKFFFARPRDNKLPEEQVRASLANKVQEIIQSEDKKNPYTDSQIADLLSRDGVSVARRTITKIRVDLGIPSSRVRKEY
jgi:RNA polymerase sigma-54 factor